MNGSWPTTRETTLSAAGMLFDSLMDAQPVLLGDARPPNTNGVYTFSFGNEIIYVGEAAGTYGLWDRICRKHLSGDEGHALQKEYQFQFPDRSLRRRFLKTNILVQWVEIPDSLVVTLVEKLAIAILEPRLNESVKKRNFK